MKPLSCRLFLVSLFVAISIAKSHADDHKGQWIDDWSDLGNETYLSPKAVYFSGAFIGKKTHLFELKISTSNYTYSAIKELGKKQKVFGENRRSDTALSEGLRGLALNVTPILQ